jgi:hypothetical protein
MGPSAARKEAMMRRVQVFDVNETLLDLAAVPVRLLARLRGTRKCQ